MFFIFHDGFIVSFVKLDVYTSETLWPNPVLKLFPLNGHIMFCLKERKYDTKL